MHYWIVNIICGFCVSAVLAGFIIPQILLIAFRKNLFDEPDERKIHHIPVPRLGGLAFMPVIFFALALMLGVNQYMGYSVMLYNFLYNVNILSMSLCSVMSLYLVGIADDLIGVRYRAKFVVQLFSALFLVASGVWVRSFYGFLGVEYLSPWVGGILAIVLVLFITNAINLIDGIDGLASGLSGVACLYYGIVYFGLHQYLFSIIAFVTLGVIVPFFFYNVFGKAEKQKKIFMGDTGALTIGFILSLLSIKLTTLPVGAISWDYNPLVVAFAPLMVPCLDVIRVFFTRIRNKKNPFLPDKNHIHHKILALGFSARPTMIIIILGSLLLSLFNLWVSKYLDVHLLLLCDFVIYAILSRFLTCRGVRSEE